MHWDDMNGWGWALMSLWMVLFWGLVIAGIVLLVRYVAGDRRQPTTPGPPGGSEAQRLLAERFARGEIDEEEYRKRLRVLGGG